MFKRARPARLFSVASVLFLSLVLWPAAAQAAQRLESFPLPSLAGNVDPTQPGAMNKNLTTLNAAVLLPDGYDAHPTADYPVVYMLEGIGDVYTGWLTSGQITTLASGLPAIVVMPEGGRGLFMDWWKGGARNGQNWQQYYLDEVIPAIESRYRVRPGRQNHSIAGLSMGGYGALLLGGALPGYFGSIVSMSGLVDSQSWDVQVAQQVSGGATYADIWGPASGPYATAKNPYYTSENLRSSRVYLSVGNGIPDISLPFTPQSLTTGVVVETSALLQNQRYAAVLAYNRVQSTLKVRIGVHDWPYWKKEFPRALGWNLFAPTVKADDAAAQNFTYKTMAPHGNMWGLGYRWQGLPSVMSTFRRSGQVLTGSGSGTVTITPGADPGDASGAGTELTCSFTVTLPFTYTLPAGC